MIQMGEVENTWKELKKGNHNQNIWYGGVVIAIFIKIKIGEKIIADPSTLCKTSGVLLEKLQC